MFFLCTTLGELELHRIITNPERILREYYYYEYYYEYYETNQALVSMCWLDSFQKYQALVSMCPQLKQIHCHPGWCKGPLASTGQVEGLKNKLTKVKPNPFAKFFSNTLTLYFLIF